MLLRPNAPGSTLSTKADTWDAKQSKSTQVHTHQESIQVRGACDVGGRLQPANEGGHRGETQCTWVRSCQNTHAMQPIRHADPPCLQSMALRPPARSPQSRPSERSAHKTAAAARCSAQSGPPGHRRARLARSLPPRLSEQAEDRDAGSRTGCERRRCGAGPSSSGKATCCSPTLAWPGRAAAVSDALVRASRMAGTLSGHSGWPGYLCPGAPATAYSSCTLPSVSGGSRVAAAARAVGRRPDRARTPRIGWHRHRAALQLACAARMAVGRASW